MVVSHALVTRMEEESGKEEEEEWKAAEEQEAKETEPGWYTHPYFEELEKERRRQKKNARKQEIHIRQCDQTWWASKRNFNPGSHLTLDQIRNLKDWFEVIDVDGSGDISLMELADPLLTTGLANSIQECKELFASIDKDGSGEIEFTEFLELITIKSSGKLERVRRRRSCVGVLDESQRVSPEEKRGGILQVLETLKKDETNSLSLTTAIGIERRKFLQNCVMTPGEEASYKLRMDREKFRAMQSLLFASLEERRQSLSDDKGEFFTPQYGLARGSYFRPATPASRGGLVSVCSEREERRASAFPPAPEMPWRRKNTKMVHEKAKVLQNEADDKEFEKTRWKSPSQQLVASKSLPKLRMIPIQNNKPLHSPLMAKVVCGSGEKEQEAFVELQRKLNTESRYLTRSCSKAVRGGNKSITERATERALRRRDMNDFFQDFCPKRASDEFFRSRERNALSHGSLQEAVQEERIAHEKRIESLFESLAGGSEPDV